MKKFVVASLLVLMVSSAYGHTRHAYRIAGDLEKYSLLSYSGKIRVCCVGYC